MTLLKSIFGTKNDRELKLLQPIVKQINQFESQLEKYSDEQLKSQTPKLKNLLASGSNLEQILPEAFATVREASKRILKMRHFDAQLMGGIILYRGIIAEMKTGEGKTLTATLPLYLTGLTGEGAHCVTVNDYLAERDAREMGVLYNWLGLSCGCILSEMSDKERQENYAKDITYGTNNEFGFDYLRDNMKFNLEDYVQRSHNFCIVDEVDSILIDEARTPLIISGPSEGNIQIYQVANQIIPKLTKTEHYKVDEKSRSAVFTEEGNALLQSILKIENLFEIKNMELLHALNQSLRAHAIFQKDVDYVVKEDKIIIVDEFTGRLKTGSRWSDGLHQAVEAKEGVKVKQENQTLASITFQNYFKLYQKLAGMTGTAETEAEEFRKIYKLDVVVIPTNRPMIRIDRSDIIYKSKSAKYRAIVNLIKDLNVKKQPILVGTISIDSSEKIAQELKKANIVHNVLNAKQHEREAEIIANAGQPGAVTIATNMAGRGTDIKLTSDTVAAGGLFILGTERHESRRIDNQLRGRSGRQGDPGESRFFLSLEDDLLRIFGSDRIKKIMNFVGMEEDEPVESKMVSGQIEKAQKKVEGHNFDIRKHLLDYDNVMNEQRRVIYRIRKEILSDLDNEGFIQEMLEDVCFNFVEGHRPDKKIGLEFWPWSEINEGFQILFHSTDSLNYAQCVAEHSGHLEEYVLKQANLVLVNKLSPYEKSHVKRALKEVLLSIFDSFWKDHLLNMDHMREGINLAAYAQKDPLSEYKHRSFDLFQEMRQNIKRAVIDNVFGMKLYTAEEIEELKRQQQAQLEAQLKAHQQKTQLAEGGKVKPVQRQVNKVGRNDPCSCGSGKKYKHCHGA
jgi:preprotein translocase subunit SecA